MEKNTNKLKVVNFVLVILVLGLTSYIIYDKHLKNSDDLMKSNNNIVDSKEENIIEEINLSNEDKIKYNKQLDDILLALDSMLPYYLSELEYNVDYLETNDPIYPVNSKVMFAWRMLLADENIEPVSIDKDYLGREVTGAIALKKQDYVDKYFELFNENVTLESLASLEIVDEVIYGFSESTTGPGKFILKAKSLTFNKEENLYELNIDVVTKFESNESSDQMVYDVKAFYGDAEVLEYPEDLVYAQMKLSYKDNGNSYSIESIVFNK